MTDKTAVGHIDASCKGGHSRLTFDFTDAPNVRWDKGILTVSGVAAFASSKRSLSVDTTCVLFPQAYWLSVPNVKVSGRVGDALVV